jgi:Xaa-Pro dipeptidase
MSTNLSGLYKGHVQTLTEGFSRALAAEGYDAVIIHSGNQVLKSDFDDQCWSMRPVPMFEYWVDVPWPECALHVPAGGSPRLFVLREPNYWERPKEPDWHPARAALEVIELPSRDDLIGMVPVDRKTAFIGAKTEDAQGFAGLAPTAVNPEGLIDRLHDLRVHKTSYEIECMAEASRIAARGHRRCEALFRSGVRSELELHLEYLKATGQDDADAPYKNIVALGDAAAILHHVFYRDVPGAKSLLVDAGARHRGYCSDITRTYAADRSLFADLLARMESLQQRIVSEVAVGMRFEDLHDRSHFHLAEALIDLGIVKGSREACVEGGITRKLYPHGLGHSLGVQVHDVGCKRTPSKPENPFLRNTTTISVGQVFTIEPGVYFIDTLLEELTQSPLASSVDWKKIDELRPYGGIRIEDNVVVLPPSGAKNVRNLTREAFAVT